MDPRSGSSSSAQQPSRGCVRYLVTHEGTAMQRTGLRLLIFRIGRHTGVPDAGVHRFRHTFAVNFLRNGGNLLALQDLLGHEWLSTTKLIMRHWSR